MNKILIVLVSFVALFYFISCNKSSTPGYFSCTGLSPASDSSTLIAFANANTITPKADTSGLYYQIIQQGSGSTPTGTSKITVTYVGRFMNGNDFDSTTSPVTFQLDSLITGWQYGLPKIKAGGHIKLLIPSALAFGCSGSGSIPPNSPLYFDIALLNVQ